MINHVVEIKKTGLVARSGDEFWGVQYSDGQVQEMGFGPIQNAKIADPRYCGKATDLVYCGSPDAAKLSNARMVHVTITTIYEVEHG